MYSGLTSTNATNLTKVRLKLTCTISPADSVAGSRTHNRYGQSSGTSLHAYLQLQIVHPHSCSPPSNGACACYASAVRVCSVLARNKNVKSCDAQVVGSAERLRTKGQALQVVSAWLSAFCTLFSPEAVMMVVPRPIGCTAIHMCTMSSVGIVLAAICCCVTFASCDLGI